MNKDFYSKYPNLRDGLALSYAAANKGKSKAAKRAIEAAYTENHEPFIKSTEDKLSQPERSKVQSTQKINEEKQSLAKLIGDPEEKSKVAKLAWEMSEKTGVEKPIDETVETKFRQELAKKELSKTQ